MQQNLGFEEVQNSEVFNSVAVRQLPEVLQRLLPLLQLHPTLHQPEIDIQQGIEGLQA